MSGRAADVSRAVLAVLRGDVGVQAAFGQTPRVLDAESSSPYFPYVQLERHETEDAGASLSAGLSHRIQLAVMTQETGLTGAKEALDAVRAALSGADWEIEGVHVVLAQVTYADVMRTPTRGEYRGLVRLRMVTEETG